MITKESAKRDLETSLTVFEVAIPAFNMAVLALLFQITPSPQEDLINCLYKICLLLTLAGILLLPIYSLRNWSESRLKYFALNTAEKYQDKLIEMAENNDTKSTLGDHMQTRDKLSNKFHLWDKVITASIINFLVPVFFINLVSFVVLTFLVKW